MTPHSSREPEPSASPAYFPTSLVVLQPSAFCNLDCHYCYLPHRDDKNRLSFDTLDGIISRLIDWNYFAPVLEVSWHSGEPLAVPIAYYKAAFPRIDPLRKIVPQVNQSIQTNGTLITDAHCELFKKHSVSVGVSIDGPAWLHDKRRPFRNGRGSHARTVIGINKLREHNVPFYAIMVAGRDSLQHAEEIYHHMKGLGVTFLGINIEEREGANKSSSLDESRRAEFVDFIDTIFRLSLADGHIIIRDLYMTATYLSRSSLPLRSVSATPGEILTFDWKGNVATLSPELVPFSEMLNTAALSIASAFARPQWREIERSVAQGLLECELSCDYYSVCGGGNPSNKIAENGSFASTETNACRFQVKEITEIVLTMLEDEKLRAKIEDVVNNRHLMRL